MGAEFCVQRMDEAGIDAGVVMTIVDSPEVNPRGARARSRTRAPRTPDGSTRSRASIPGTATRRSRCLERAITEYGFKGLKLHPVTTIAHPARARTTLRLIRAAAAHGVPTLFHCGDEPLTTPLAVAAAAEACPEATMILGHMGGYHHVDEAIEVARAACRTSCSRRRRCRIRRRSARRSSGSGPSA